MTEQLDLFNTRPPQRSSAGGAFAQFRTWVLWFEATYGSPARAYIPDLLDLLESDPKDHLGVTQHR